MNPIRRAATVLGLMFALASMFVAPAQASVTGPTGVVLRAESAQEPPHEYSPQNPAYENVTAGGRFTGQVSFGEPNLRYAWGVKIAPDIIAGIVGRVLENTITFCDGKEVARSNHLEPADYMFHGSNVVDPACQNYILDGTLTFTYQGAMGTIYIHDNFVVRP